MSLRTRFLVGGLLGLGVLAGMCSVGSAAAPKLKPGVVVKVVVSADRRKFHGVPV